MCVAVLPLKPKLRSSRYEDGGVRGSVQCFNHKYCYQYAVMNMQSRSNVVDYAAGLINFYVASLEADGIIWFAYFIAWVCLLYGGRSHYCMGVLTLWGSKPSSILHLHQPLLSLH